MPAPDPLDPRPSSDPSAELPLDPDVLVDARGVPPRPVHLRSVFLVWVALGGVLGAAARIGVGDALPRPGGFPLPTLLVNVSGALVLGVLLEALARRGADEGARRLVRLGAGTGFCGAYTTFSSFAVDTDLLVHDGRPLLALGYLAATLLGGLLATSTGVWAASARSRTGRGAAA